MPDSDHAESDAAWLDEAFTEPDTFRPKPPDPTTVVYNILTPNLPLKTLNIHLIAQHVLEAHTLWNGARYISEWLEERPDIVRGKTVLEIGAGGGLPSIVCGLVLGAEKVVMTDWPDEHLVRNMWSNVDENYARYRGVPLPNEDSTAMGSASTSIDGGVLPPLYPRQSQDTVVADGYKWGADPAPLFTHLPLSTSKFDILILADTLFKHGCHPDMLRTIQLCLAKTPEAKALVFFTSYRPWLRHKDLAFFDLVKENGFEVEQVLDRRLEKPLFENDPGDVEVQKIVGGYEVRWKRGELEKA